MILRRLTTNLRAQNWTAITIEFLIVVIGVFVGVQASNWNQARLERRETEHLLKRIEPQIDQILVFAASAREYYGTTRRFADIAFAGWSGDPKVDDNEFVIAAYQASQVYGFGASQSWSAVFGADQLRNIDDDRLRIPLARLMTFDTGRLNAESVFSRYRDDVRLLIPDPVQQAIRKSCGDRLRAGDFADIGLPPSCPLELNPTLAKHIAADLRNHSELPRELRLHLSMVSVYFNYLSQYEGEARLVRDRLSSLNR